MKHGAGGWGGRGSGGREGVCGWEGQGREDRGVSRGSEGGGVQEGRFFLRARVKSVFRCVYNRIFFGKLSRCLWRAAGTQGRGRRGDICSDCYTMWFPSYINIHIFCRDSNRIATVL